MAVSTSNKFSIAAGSPPSIVGAFDKFAKDATPKYPCGYKVEMADGTVLRYAHFGEDVDRGVLVSQDVSESLLTEDDDNIIAPASCVDTSDGTIGSRYIQATLTATVDQYAGGKLITTDDTGEGYTYDIIGNTATNDPATGDIRIELAQPLQVAVDATTDIVIVGNLYANLEIANAGVDDIISGVTCSTMDVSEAAWGWVQTKGVCGILADGTPAAGTILTLSDGTNGAVQALAGGGTDVADVITEPIVGFCLTVPDSGGHCASKINLE
jgi:hypothetical protein